MVQVHIAPSILAADFANLSRDCHAVINSGADWLHIDIMDGHFVPNITLGPPVVTSLRAAVPRKLAFFDCHMMVSKPEEWVSDLARAGADQYCFHFEATENPLKLIEQIHAAGMKAGVAIKPGTPVEVLYSLADTADMFLVMTVEPGFGGQKFMENCMEKVQILRKKYPNMNIQVDGGLGPSTIESAADAGANIIVAGTSIYKAEDQTEMIKLLKDTVLASHPNFS